MLHDILMILANLAALIVAFALLALIPYIIMFLICMIPGIMFGSLIGLLTDALLAHTSFHNQAMAVVGPMSVALAVAIAAYLTMHISTTADSSTHRAAEENRSPSTWNPSPTSHFAARARQEREWREWCRAQS